jgi:hypothetical protein
MKFVCLLPVRDEADIIGQCLDHLLTWADEICIFDTGSVDNTWELVREAAARDRRIKALHQDPVFFSDTHVRGWLFHQARSQLRAGDWFLRADADEFYHLPPPEFVRTRMEKHETIAWHQHYNFRFTASELRRWEQGEESLADRQRPIADRRRWFTPSRYSEPRLCRYRETMRWPPRVSFPFNAGFVACERLPIRHYPHRDPVQLERRCRLRAAMMADPQNRANWSQPQSHPWTERDWRRFVAADNLPDLRYWEPGADLPRFHFRNHLRRPPVRLAQRLAHAFLLPLLDRNRPGWPRNAYPQPIPPPVVARLNDELTA